MELIRSYCPINVGPPTITRGDGSCVNRFEACSAFTHVTACMLAKSPKRPSTPEAPTASFPPPPLRLLPGGANPVPGRDFHPQSTSAFSRRTCHGGFIVNFCGAARGAGPDLFSCILSCAPPNGSFPAGSEPETNTARIPEVVLRRVVELVGEARHQVVDLHRANLEGFINGNVEAATDGHSKGVPGG